jgi:hypothetical protein
VEDVNRDRVVAEQGPGPRDETELGHRRAVVEPVAAEGALHRLAPGVRARLGNDATQALRADRARPAAVRAAQHREAIVPLPGLDEARNRVGLRLELQSRKVCRSQA